MKVITYLVAACAAATSLAVAVEPAFAARTLYTYADNNFRGARDAPRVHSGFSFVLEEEFPFGTTVDVSTMTCVAAVSLCSSVAVRSLYPNDGGSGADVTYNTEAGEVSRNFYKGTSSSSSYQSSTVRTLADTDVVYSYADSRGVMLTFVSNGYLDFANTALTAITSASCSTGEEGCSRAWFTGGPTASLKLAKYGNSGLLADATSLDIPRDFLLSSGSFTLRQSGVSAQLYVLAPLAFATAVPEPATWIMMLLGFGMVSAMTRYRRRSATPTFA